MDVALSSMDDACNHLPALVVPHLPRCPRASASSSRWLGVFARSVSGSVAPPATPGDLAVARILRGHHVRSGRPASIAQLASPQPYGQADSGRAPAGRHARAPRSTSTSEPPARLRYRSTARKCTAMTGRLSWAPNASLATGRVRTRLLSLLSPPSRLSGPALTGPVL